MADRRVLVVDDEEGILELVADTLEEAGGVTIVPEADSSAAARRLATESFDLLITDVRMPGVSGVDLLRVAKRYDPQLPVLMLTAYPSVETAVESMKLGATDYVTKPFLPDDLLVTVHRILDARRLQEENRLLRRHIERAYFFDEILGRSPAMLAVFDTIERVATTGVDILVAGETGTGKELVARSLHERSQRGGRFVPVDCGAIPENLLESEFFGHERGAYTGAQARSLGLIELAEGGTFFLDEIGELPLPLQAKILRVLQERSFRRVGGRDEITVDVRVVVATNRDLAQEVVAGRFRADLYYRINVVQIDLPPLRDRGDDLLLLADHFVGRYAQEMDRAPVTLGPEVLDVLQGYPWPGNVRELQNVLKRAVALAREPLLTIEELPDGVVAGSMTSRDADAGSFFAARADRVAAFEREYLDRLLQRFDGDVTRAAEQAKTPRGTLYRLLKKHGLAPDDYRG